MIVKLGDLVQLEWIEDNNRIQDIWLVIGWNGWNDYIKVQNVATGHICQYNLRLLKHFKSEEVCK